MSVAQQPVYVSDQVKEVDRLHRDLLTDDVRRLPIRDQLDRQASRGSPDVGAEIEGVAGPVSPGRADAGRMSAEEGAGET